MHGHFTSFNVSKCVACNGYAIWLHGRLIWPASSTAPPANPDLPESIRQDYAEAAQVLPHSPRAAAALLRLAVEKLAQHLVEKIDGPFTGRPPKVDDLIAKLVERGLSEKILLALDVVRVIGNEAVHPGTIDLKDDEATAISLFPLINLVAERMITEDRHISEAFAALPESKRKAIEARNERARAKRKAESADPTE
jgi:hypothetical protein